MGTELLVPSRRVSLDVKLRDMVNTAFNEDSLGT